MSEAHDQIERALAESGRPIDITEEAGLEPDVPPDRTRQFSHTGFSRMRREWPDDDAAVMAEVRAYADDVIRQEFRVAFLVIERLRRSVREPLVDKVSGEVQAYDDGTPKWELDEDGLPVEKWHSLSDGARSDARHLIVTYLAEWQMLSIDKWAEAMFAKVQWEERFARGFTALSGADLPGKPTIDDRTQWGHRLSSDERYFAVFKAYVSKKADALIRTMMSLERLLESTAIR
jgi:hypothetical protein